MDRKPENIFVNGPVNAEDIARSIQRLSEHTGTGAHSIFLGQVRADAWGGDTVAAIHYTAYEEMALEKALGIREDIFAKYPLTCLHICHSLGEVKAGEVSLFVLAASKHRRAAIEACAETVERIKKDLPVWGKEITDTEEENWKVNT